MTSISDPDIIGKRLQLLKEVLPGASRLAIVPGPRPLSSAQEVWLRDTEAAAKALGLTVQVLEKSKDPSQWDEVFAAAVGKRVDALYAIEGASYIFHAKHIAEVALKYRMPTVFGFRVHAEAGGLLVYGANLFDLYSRAANYVDKILKGAKPADLPVEQPTKFELVINLKTGVDDPAVPADLGRRDHPVISRRALMVGYEGGFTGPNAL
jgi:putative ABC transport system substrate-binding protein